MATIPVLSQPLDRNELQKFLPPENFRLIKAFENMSIDVSTTIPENIEDQSIDIAAAQAAADAAQASANAAQATANSAIVNAAAAQSSANAAQSTANSAQSDANALELKAYIAIAPDAGIPNARGLGAGVGINLTDGGAGGTLAVSVNQPALDLANISGTLTAGQLPLLSAFSAHNNGVAQSIPDNAFTTLALSTEAYDVLFDFSSNSWTPPAGRPVTMTGAVTIATGTGPFTVSIFKNGVEYKRGARMALAAAEITVTVAAQDVPNGTDVYTLRAFQNTGAAQNTLGTSVKTYFQGAAL